MSLTLVTDWYDGARVSTATRQRMQGREIARAVGAIGGKAQRYPVLLRTMIRRKAGNGPGRRILNLGRGRTNNAKRRNLGNQEKHQRRSCQLNLHYHSRVQTETRNWKVD